MTVRTSLVKKQNAFIFIKTKCFDQYLTSTSMFLSSFKHERKRLGEGESCETQAEGESFHSFLELYYRVT